MLFHMPQLLTNDYISGRRQLSPRQVTIAAALARYHFLTTPQVQRLFFSPASLRHAQRLVSGLADAGFCERLKRHRLERSGSVAPVYGLTGKARAQLEGMGIEVRRRFRPSEERRLTDDRLAHTLALNDILITIERFCSRFPQVTIDEFVHERNMPRVKVSFLDAKGQPSTRAVIPDGWIKLFVTGSARPEMCLAIECDRGTLKSETRWREKVRGLLAWSRGPYQDTFGTRSLTVLIVATPGERRKQQLVRWTEAELRTLGEEHAPGAGELFSFTGLPMADIPPETFFLAPCWTVPFDGAPRRLLGKEELGG